MKTKQNILELKKKLLVLSLYGGVTLTSLTGCSKTVKCDVEVEHVHQYENDEGLKKYIPGEKEKKKKFIRTDEYTTDYNIINNVSAKKLCVVNDNINYINEVISAHQPKREAYVLDYVYGPHYTYGYGLDYSTGKYDYHYGLFWEDDDEYVWKEISLYEYTPDEVRDYTYSFKFYKIDENNNLVSKDFKTLEDVEENYKYFDDNDFVQEHISDSYFLNKEDFKTRKLSK